MLRNYQAIPSYSQYTQDIIRQTAFHEAGHAASIYLGNRLKKLPPVFFKIQISQPNNLNEDLFAKVIDGRLIQSLPTTGLDKLENLSAQEQLLYQTAYEADVINLLVGPLAEAKYVSIRDNEALNFNLLNTQALNYYGGASDIEQAYAYLEYFLPSEALREDKMLALFSQAFQFIDQHENWKCILNLAHYILESQQESISCEEAVAVLKGA